MQFTFYLLDVPPMSPAVYYPASVDGKWSSVSGKDMQVKLQQYKIEIELLGSFFLFVHTDVKFQSQGWQNFLDVFLQETLGYLLYKTT